MQTPGEGRCQRLSPLLGRCSPRPSRHVKTRGVGFVFASVRVVLMVVALGVKKVLPLKSLFPPEVLIKSQKTNISLD